MTEAKKIYASTKSPVINAIIEGLYSFKTADDAHDLLKSLRQKFIISSSIKPEARRQVILWVKNYALNKNEKAEGRIGNFGLFEIAELEKKKFTVKISKIEVETKKHPQAKYQKQQNPNWGYPLLRGIKKKKIYKTIDAAKRDLTKIQEDFPQVSIPAANKLYTIIYEPNEMTGERVKKYTLEIKEADGNKFFIDFYENIPTDKPIVKKEEEKPTQEAIGKFTSSLLLKRSKKKPRK